MGLSSGLDDPGALLRGGDCGNVLHGPRAPIAIILAHIVSALDERVHHHSEHLEITKLAKAAVINTGCPG